MRTPLLLLAGTLMLAACGSTETAAENNLSAIDNQIARADTPQVRPGQAVSIGRINIDPEVAGGPVGPTGPGNVHATGGPVGPTVTDIGEAPEVRPAPTPAPTPRPQDSGPLRLASTIISSKAIDKPAPPYPPVAKAAGVQGTVAVQIVVDEQGRVVSAKASSGNPLLLNAAVQAAYRARFTPTLLGGQPVKITGSITYNFVIR